MPDALHQLRVEKREGGQGIQVWIDSLEGLPGLVDVDVVEVHPWGARGRTVRGTRRQIHDPI
jgi:bifunctional non-homologous end joining protein LigD